MSRNKINFKSKIKLHQLSETFHETDSTSLLNLISSSSNSKTITLRLRKIDMERLDEILQNVNKVNQSHPFNRNNLFRGLLMLALEIEPQKLSQYIRNSI